MEAHFYNYITVAAMLILYGVLFLVVESRRTAPHVTHLEQITYRDALIIGVWQMLAIIPGTSRSGATIVGGLLLGLSRACVAEFTFYLAIPVMAGASLLKVLKFAVSGVAITGTEVAVLAVGCVVAFVVSLAAIRFLMDYVKRHNFTFFGIYASPSALWCWPWQWCLQWCKIELGSSEPLAPARGFSCACLCVVL